MPATIQTKGRDYNWLSILSASGADLSRVTYADGVLTLPDVTQEAADAALSAYDHKVELARRGRDEAKADLVASDLPLIRGIEDIIDTLAAKGLITRADLPAVLLDKIGHRKALRTKV